MSVAMNEEEQIEEAIRLSIETAPSFKDMQAIIQEINDSEIANAIDASFASNIASQFADNVIDEDMTLILEQIREREELDNIENQIVFEELDGFETADLDSNNRTLTPLLPASPITPSLLGLFMPLSLNNSINNTDANVNDGILTGNTVIDSDNTDSEDIADILEQIRIFEETEKISKSNIYRYQQQEALFEQNKEQRRYHLKQQIKERQFIEDQGHLQDQQILREQQLKKEHDAILQARNAKTKAVSKAKTKPVSSHHSHQKTVAANIREEQDDEYAYTLKRDIAIQEHKQRQAAYLESVENLKKISAVKTQGNVLGGTAQSNRQGSSQSILLTQYLAPGLSRVISSNNVSISSLNIHNVNNANDNADNDNDDDNANDNADNDNDDDNADDNADDNDDDNADDNESTYTSNTSYYENEQDLKDLEEIRQELRRELRRDFARN